MSIASDIAQIKKENSEQKRLKILTLDIETSPNLAYVWQLWKENIPLERFLEAGHILCITAKWYDSSDIIFLSDFHTGHDEMIYQLWDLLNEADVVVTYNGDRFDLLHNNTEFAKLTLGPPSPYKSIDLYKVIKRSFKLPSYKLAYVLQFFGIGAKVKHSGFELWPRCMAGDAEAWEEMRTYNIGDVVGTEDAYTYFKAWIKNHPNVAPIDEGDEDVCPRCGSNQIAPAGKVDRTPSFEYPALICLDCGGWLKAKNGKRISNLRSI